MIINKKTILLNFIAIVFCCNVFSQNQSMKRVVDSLIFFKEVSGKQCTDCIKNNLDSAIFLLIENINLDKKRFIGYQDPYSSYLAPNPNYVGINALYFLEIILRDSLNNTDITKIKLFTKCTLISKKNKSFPLTMKDMNYIKSVYKKWYKETANLPLLNRQSIWKRKYQGKISVLYEWM